MNAVLFPRLRCAATPERTAAAAAAGFSVIAAFQASLALGAPFGEAAFGGSNSGQLPPGLRAASAVSMVVWLLAALMVLARGRSVPAPAGRAVRWGVRGFIVLLAVGTLLNAASSSPWERFLWAPLALVLLLLCLRLDRHRAADGSPAGPAA
ncbi:hypothetical protein E2F48_09650 [Arthrobacter crusticola]|uniref:Uncharacterized protein n=1 Tax=Arthrobacter crusticola TaxID=2547960 RepID=A0A4R5TWI3_9MICC|nr:hypothetical protein [Arthrobacter crusticola]TDK25507.1 hypothetical protein E2F48_09650 [Arthrobacter crusticola]